MAATAANGGAISGVGPTKAGGGDVGGPSSYAATTSLLDGSSAGYHLLEDLERKGLDAKTYIQTMLRYST
jgi:hypothetical protein